MAVSIAEVSHPNAPQTYLSGFAPFKAKIIDVTFDATYPAGGEPLTAAMLGWDGIFGALVLKPAMVSSKATSYMTSAVVNAAQSQVDLVLHETAGTVDLPFDENDTANVSTYSTRLLVLGY